MSPVPGPILVDPGAASLSVAGDELIGPLADAARPKPLDLAGTIVEVPAARWPVVLCTLADDLGNDAVEITVTLRPAGGGPAVPQPGIRFAPWTEHGTQLVMFVPPVDPQGASAACSVRLGASRVDGAGVSTAIPAARLGDAVRIELVQGVLGRVAAVMLSEKGRLRRQAREIRAMRALGIARDDALDRMGRDVGAGRFRDELSWDAAAGQVATTPLPGGAFEDDPSFRIRLATLRQTRLPSPAWIDGMLNGDGAPSSPGTGWLADVGIATRLSIDETPNPLLIAFQLIAPGGKGNREQLIDAIRTTHLVWPAGSPAGNTAHRGRMITPDRRRRADAGRTALAALQCPPGEPVAPAIAVALARLVEIQGLLGAQPVGRVVAGQSLTGDSRLELGLGARLAAPAAGQLQKAVAAARTAGDPALRPVPVADDPIGAWLLRGCGLRTAHRLSDGSVFVSGLSTGGLVISAAPATAGAVPLTLSARIDSAADATHDAPLVGVIAAVTGEGVAAPAATAALVGMLQPTAAVPALETAIANLGLPRIESARQLADIQPRLVAVHPRDVAAFDLGPSLSKAISNDPSRLASLLGVAARAGASSALPAVTSGGTLALILGVVDLPLAGNNLAGQHTVAYRWQIRALIGAQPAFGPRRGPSTTVTGETAGLAIATCLAYVRTGGSDPYQWRPSLPTGTLLTLRQYEHLMNVVELVTPIGVRADTWAIRRQHVDVDGAGTADRLPPSAARTYRRYRPQHP
jgi:hypothetical protein